MQLLMLNFFMIISHMVLIFLPMIKYLIGRESNTMSDLFFN